MSVLITDFAASSCLGDGYEINGAALRCGYDGFLRSNTYFSDKREEVILAQVSGLDGITGVTRLQKMAERVVTEIVDKLEGSLSNTPIFLCLPSADRPDVSDPQYQSEELYRRLNKTFDRQPHSLDRLIMQDRVGFAAAIDLANEFFEQGQTEVLIVSVDSMATSSAIRTYEGQLGQGNGRILRNGNSAGFIPGEAATACVVKPFVKNKKGCLVPSVAWGYEPVLISSSQPLRGEGVSQAVKKLQEQTNTTADSFSFITSSVSGEVYFFDEAVIAQRRLEGRGPDDQPLWHPADQIGEVGSVAGSFMVIQAYYAMPKGYAPGYTALALLSNDNHHRAAMYLKFQGGDDAK